MRVLPTAFVISLLAFTGTAAAYSPCERAQREADAAFQRYAEQQQRQCGNRSPCYFNERTRAAYNDYIEAQQRANRECAF